MTIALRDLLDPDVIYTPSDLTRLFFEDWQQLRDVLELGTEGLNTAAVAIAGTEVISGGRTGTFAELLPDADNIRNLGSAVRRWNTLYCTTLSGSGTGLTGVLLLAGGTMAGDIDMGTNAITNLAEGAAGTDAVNFDQLAAVEALLDPRVVSKTTDYVITAAENGTLFNNTGASGAVDFELPTAAAGYVFSVRRTAAQTVTISASTGDTIALGASVTAAGGTINVLSDGAAVTLESVDGTAWWVTAIEGAVEFA